MMSVAPPGGNGTTMRTGFAGKACASAAPGSARREAASSAAARTRPLMPAPRRVSVGQRRRASSDSPSCVVGHAAGRARVVAIELLEIERAAPAWLRRHAVHREEMHLARHVAKALGIQPEPHQMPAPLRLRELDEPRPRVHDRVVVDHEHVAALEEEGEPVLRRPGDLVEQVHRGELVLGQRHAERAVAGGDARALVAAADLAVAARRRPGCGRASPASSPGPSSPSR